MQTSLRARDTHERQHLQRTLARVCRRDLLVIAHGLGDLLADRIDRIHGQHGFLENHRHGLAAEILERATFQRRDVHPLDLDAALDPRALRRVQAQDRAQRHALAGARLAE